MSDMDINKMDFKALRNEVQSLRDELAIFKRKYEDMIYNLDSDNLGKGFMLEQNNLKTQITIAAGKIESMVSDTDLEDALSNYSKITQTADYIQSIVSKSANLSAAEEVDSYDDLKNKDKDGIYVIRTRATDEDGKEHITSERYYYYNDVLKSWELLSGDSIYTVFQQTPEGFVIDGNTVITKNLKLSGNVTWDMSNSPVQARYSSDGANWHPTFSTGDLYMQMTFDGKNWGNTIKVVGTDSSGGSSGISKVTPQMVFDALTDDGANQGIFAAFVEGTDGEGKTRIYINSEYLATKIANVADNIYLGDRNSNGGKGITFNTYAKIFSFLDGTAATGLEISASTVRLSGGALDISGCTSINWGKNAPVAVFG